ncbi:MULTISPECIES: DUF2922 domain-containing protein [unclassified Lactobacillus]|uniref:DUF2922 domain-containing protein n=1 Tax=unclassified Lactobacillus TaxID=2620435 RepID=UPI000BEEB11A|nr:MULTISPECIES: DUF2922 domain-containing protein [unclassified Lactobacillus]PEG86231.1 hypothetical protein CP365_09295 [Lactobacillus sp. UMNPBX14]PEH01765.1 hypothetical protein CP357_09360 [Lactobacillus sp. UMNPBX6]
MATTTKTLKLTFLNGEKKKNSITLADAVDNLTEEQVRQAMNTIASVNVFEKDGVAYYETSQSASYVERTVSDIFNDGANSESASADKQD